MKFCFMKYCLWNIGIYFYVCNRDELIKIYQSINLSLSLSLFVRYFLITSREFLHAELRETDLSRSIPRFSRNFPDSQASLQFRSARRDEKIRLAEINKSLVRQITSDQSHVVVSFSRDEIANEED